MNLSLSIHIASVKEIQFCGIYRMFGRTLVLRISLCSLSTITHIPFLGEASRSGL